MTEGDHITYLNVFNSFEEEGGGADWCEENCLNYRALVRAGEIRQQLSRCVLILGGDIAAFSIRHIRQAMPASTSYHTTCVTKADQNAMRATDSCVRFMVGSVFNRRVRF